MLDKLKRKPTYLIASIIILAIFAFGIFIAIKNSDNGVEGSIQHEITDEQLIDEENILDDPNITDVPDKIEISSDNSEHKKMFIAKYVFKDEGTTPTRYIETAIYDLDSGQITEQHAIREDNIVKSVDYNPDTNGFNYIVGCGVLECDYPTDKQCVTSKFEVDQNFKTSNLIGTYKLGCNDRYLTQYGSDVYVAKTIYTQNHQNVSFAKQNLTSGQETTLVSDIQTSLINNNIIVKNDRVFWLRQMTQDDNKELLTIEEYQLPAMNLLFSTEIEKRNDVIHRPILTLSDDERHILFDVYDLTNNTMYLYDIDTNDLNQQKEILITDDNVFADTRFSQDGRYYAYVTKAEKQNKKETLHVFDLRKNLLLNTPVIEEDQINLMGNHVWLNSNPNLLLYEFSFLSSTIKYIDLNMLKIQTIEIEENSFFYDQFSNEEFLVYGTKKSWGDCCGTLDLKLWDIKNSKEIKLPEFFQNIEESAYDSRILEIYWL